jgi:hypothetical protein
LNQGTDGTFVHPEKIENENDDEDENDSGEPRRWRSFFPHWH